MCSIRDLVSCIIMFAYLHASDRTIVPYLNLNVICQMIEPDLTERGPVCLFPLPTYSQEPLMTSAAIK